MSKKFAAAGGTLEIIHSAEDIEAVAATYVAIYSASWKVPEPYPEFMPGLIRHLAASGRLRLGIASLHGRPIAAQVWAVQSGRAAIIKLAHREDSTEYSAGTLLTALLMEHVISIDRVREVDYLIGDDPYKQNWMSHRRERWGIVAYNPRTLVGLLLLVRELAARTAKILVQASRRLSESVRVPSQTS
jgi:CelD/BcsL family acetyltransferase involved in cellulose biosynthesis